MADPIRTTCPYCGVGCGVLAMPNDDGSVTIKGDPEHPANFGRLCSKGAALADTLGHDGRLRHPVVDGRRVSWERAVATVAERFSATIAAHGPESVGFYVSGQLLSEDYYVANKLMKGFIGAANIDTNSRLCMASTVAGQVRAFGGDAVPGCYEDWEQADLVVLVGSNTAWCHPVLYQRLVRARERRGTRVIVIDPRRTETCAIANQHLALAPGSDVALFNGLLAHLLRAGHGDGAFIRENTSGVGKALRTALTEVPDLESAAAACDLTPDEIRRFYSEFASTERVLTVFSQGVNQSVQGSDKVNAIINCHLYTGRIGRPGMGPFSVTGQPNAMGGREVGGLATVLAAHMGFSPPERMLVQEFWNSPEIAARPGLKAVDMFEAVHEGQIKALWVMGTNPAVSLPDGNRVREALARCDFLVVSDSEAATDTTRHADVLLPAATWGERDGTVTNSERCISRQRPFARPPGEARRDWRIVCDVAAAMGFASGFPYTSAQQIFDEHARLSAAGNGGRRAFDLSGLVGLGVGGYDALEPVQWPVRAQGGTTRLFTDGAFLAFGQRARFVAVAPRQPSNPPDRHFPLLLNTGRVRDHWHTMTRTGRAPRLSRHRPEPFIEVHPADAEALGLADGGLGHLQSALGVAVLRLRVTSAQRRGEVFAPMHWSDTNSAAGAIGRLVGGEVDPLSGQPGLKRAPVRLAAYHAGWCGFAISRQPVAPTGAAYWARVAVAGGSLLELAGDGEIEAAMTQLRRAADGDGDWITYEDHRHGIARAARIRDGRLQACLFLSRGRTAADRDWLLTLFGDDPLDAAARAALVAGRPVDPPASTGPVVCACLSVGWQTIVDAIRDDALTTPAEIGAAVGAGTNCGSCIPELYEILAEHAPPTDLTSAA